MLFACLLCGFGNLRRWKAGFPVAIDSAALSHTHSHFRLQPPLVVISAHMCPTFSHLAKNHELRSVVVELHPAGDGQSGMSTKHAKENAIIKKKRKTKLTYSKLADKGEPMTQWDPRLASIDASLCVL